MILFFKKIMIFSSTVLVFFVFTSYFLIKNNNESYQILYRYQLDKIGQADTVDTLLVGDSSLGNSIDSVEFSKLSSQTAINCALTGLYGYAGSYNILKTAYERHPEIKNVIIMQTLDMQTRPISYAGYARTADSLDDFMELSIMEKIIFIKEFILYVTSIRPNYVANKKDLIKNDYIKQGDPISPPDSIEGFDSNVINPEKNKFLARIADYCLKNNLNVIYINGPIYEKMIYNSQSYINKINESIPRSGIRLIPTVVNIKSGGLGDSIDHVKPELRKEYTARYYEIIKRYLKNKNGLVAEQ